MGGMLVEDGIFHSVMLLKFLAAKYVFKITGLKKIMGFWMWLIGI